MITFKTEAQFEQAFVEVLTHKGWESDVLKNKTEADLLKTGRISYLKTIASKTA